MGNFKLRDYQEEIVVDACQSMGVLPLVYLAMEVRTGKTHCALEIAKRKNAKNVLFCTKKKAIASIEQDYKDASHTFELTVTNYENLHNIKPGYDFYILDEAHTLGAFPKPSLRTKQLKVLCVGRPILLLSGTPTPESYSQLYHQLYVSSFSIFKEYKNFYAWAKHFVTVKPVYLYGRQINNYSTVHAEGLEIIEIFKAMFFKTFTQAEAGFEQVVKEYIHEVEMLPVTYELCSRLKRDRVIEGKTGVILADTEVKLMSKLHQMYSGTVKLENGNVICFDKSKADYIFDRFFRTGKMAIFYKFIEEGVMLREMFPCNTCIAEDFNDDATGDLVYIGQIQSSREGVNLSTADYLIMYNIDYSAVSYWQARARMQSKDREKEAVVYWIFAKRSIEHRIHNAVSNKKNYTLSHFKKDVRINRTEQDHSTVN